MTKTLTKTTLALLALGMAVPAMAATDGTPGSTSTGNVQVSLQVNPPAADTVHIFGLDDIALPAITRVAGQATSPFFSPPEFFCLTRSSPGTVNIQVTQSGGASLNGRYSLNGAGGKILDRVLVEIFNPAGDGSGTSIHGHNFLSILPAGANCTAASAGGVANAIDVAIPSIPADSDVSDGALSQTFTLLVTPS